MAKKPASLEAALSGHNPIEATATEAMPTAQTAEIVAHPASRARTNKAGEVKMTVYLPQAAAKRIRLMCVEHDRDLNSYLREGLDLMLAKYGQPSLAEFAKK